MESRKRKLTLGLGVLGILLVLAWNAFTGGEDTDRLAGTPEDVVTTERHRSDRVRAARPRGAATEETPAPTRLEDESKEDRVPTEDVWGPLYDGRLKAGEARIHANLGSAGGRPLIARSVGRRPVLRLWRKLGPFALEIHDNQWDRKASQVILGRQGLEPGLFQLELDGGGYGSARSSFNIGSDAQVHGEVRFPGRWRVVGLRFIDQDGQPLPYLTDVPRFEERTGTTLPDRSAQPPHVLRDPPAVTTLETLYGVGGFSSSSPNRRRRSRAKYETLNGTYYVAVISGVTGFIKIPRQARLYTTKDVLRSKFEGKAWDDRVIRVERHNGYAAGMERRTLANADDPGGVKAVDDRLRMAPPSNPVTPPRVTDPFDVPAPASRSWTRFIVDLGNHPTLQLVGVRSRGSASPQRDPLTVIRRQESLQWTSIRRSETPWERFTDGRLYRSYWKALKHTPEGLRILSPPPQEQRVTLTIAASPTLAGLGRIMTVHLDQGADFAPRRHVAVTPSLDGLYRLESSLSAGQVERLEKTGTAQLVLGFGSDLSAAEKHQITVPFSKAMVARLLTGGLDVDITKVRFSAQRITFRCVGSISEGLPWVEGSIIPYGDDSEARTMRKILSARRSKGRASPTIAGLDEPPEEESDVSSTPERLARIRTRVGRFLDGLSPADLRTQGGKDLAAIFPEPRHLRRFVENGSWYDAWNKVGSDGRGFIVATAPYLVPGRYYVLYLWSKSRDQVKPDRRIVFQAHPGFTDLGVISLPSY